MKSEDYLIISVIVAVLASLTMFILSDDNRSWVQTEDKNCVMKVDRYNSVFGEDSVERVRYCIEKPRKTKK